MLKNILIGFVCLIALLCLIIVSHLTILITEVRSESYRKGIAEIRERVSSVLKQHDERMDAMDKRINQNQKWIRQLQGK